jgi:hypothetical protein
MAAPFGQRNPRPTHKARVVLPVKGKPKPSFTSNRSLYACIGAVIAILILGAVALQS